MKESLIIVLSGLGMFAFALLVGRMMKYSSRGDPSG